MVKIELEAQEGRPQLASVLQAFSYIMCANILLAKASHMVRPRLSGVGKYTPLMEVG